MERGGTQPGARGALVFLDLFGMKGIAGGFALSLFLARKAKKLPNPTGSTKFESDNLGLKPVHFYALQARQYQYPPPPHPINPRGLDKIPDGYPFPFGEEKEISKENRSKVIEAIALKIGFRFS